MIYSPYHSDIYMCVVCVACCTLVYKDNSNLLFKLHHRTINSLLSQLVTLRLFCMCVCFQRPSRIKLLYYFLFVLFLINSIYFCDKFAYSLLDCGAQSTSSFKRCTFFFYLLAKACRVLLLRNICCAFQPKQQEKERTKYSKKPFTFVYRKIESI